MLKKPIRRFKEQVSATCQLGQRSYNLQLPYYAHEARVDILQRHAAPLCRVPPITCLKIAIFAVFRVVTTNNAAFWDVMQLIDSSEEPIDAMFKMHE